MKKRKIDIKWQDEPSTYLPYVNRLLSFNVPVDEENESHSIKERFRKQLGKLRAASPEYSDVCSQWTLEMVSEDINRLNETECLIRSDILLNMDPKLPEKKKILSTLNNFLVGILRSETVRTDVNRTKKRKINIKWGDADPTKYLPFVDKLLSHAGAVDEEDAHSTHVLKDRCREHLQKLRNAAPYYSANSSLWTYDMVSEDVKTLNETEAFIRSDILLNMDPKLPEKKKILSTLNNFLASILRAETARTLPVMSQAEKKAARAVGLMDKMSQKRYSLVDQLHDHLPLAAASCTTAVTVMVTTSTASSSPSSSTGLDDELKKVEFAVDPRDVKQPKLGTDDITTTVSSSSASGDKTKLLTPKVAFVFTPQHDCLIVEGVGLYAKDWSRNWNAVGKHAGVSAQQAAGRWSSHLDPRIASHKHGPWTEQEVSHLIELIKKTPRRTSSGHAGHIDWPLISEMLNRSEGECASKWKYQKTCLSGSSVGVTKYRSSSRIIFTPEHDKLIKEGVELFGREIPNWQAVGKHAGITSVQAQGRWNRCLNPRHASRRHGRWTEEEVRLLVHLVEVTPKRSTGSHAGQMNWAAISEGLNRTEQDCSDKCDNMRLNLRKDMLKRKVKENEELDSDTGVPSTGSSGPAAAQTAGEGVVKKSKEEASTIISPPLTIPADDTGMLTDKGDIRDADGVDIEDAVNIMVQMKGMKDGT